MQAGISLEKRLDTGSKGQVYKISREEDLTTRGLALLDWDNTLRPGFTIVEWTRFLSIHDCFSAHFANEVESTVDAYSRKEISYDHLTETLPLLYGEGLAGRHESRARSLARIFAEIDTSRIFPFARELIHLLKSFSLRVIVVSGAPAEPLLPFLATLRLDGLYALTVQVELGKYTKRLSVNPATTAGKVAVVEELGREAPIIFSMGDSHADLPLLEAARHRVVMDNPGLMEAGLTVQHFPAKPTAQDLGKLAASLNLAMLDEEGA
jgi:phosphoserine phosphatase